MEISEIKKYTNLLNIEPNNINYLYKLGNIYEKQNLFMKAIIDCYIKIIKIEPNNIIILNQIGICYFNSSQNKLAIHYFNKVLKIKELPDVYCNIGKCYVNLIDYKLAETNFLKAYNLTHLFLSFSNLIYNYYNKSIFIS